MIRHGLANKHPLYATWKTMRQRCLNPKCKKFKNYGIRGIKVCEQWNDFEQYLKDIGERPTVNHSIDRIDNDGNYEPGNVRWALSTVQCYNKTNTKRIDTPFGKMYFRELSIKTGIAYACLRTRYYRDGKTGNDLIRPTS